MKVTQYFVGFGRTVWSTRRGETEYGLKAIPLGGYVKLVGMLPPAKDDPLGRPRQSNTGMFTQLISDARHAEAELIRPEDEHRLFYRLPWTKKVIVMAGGPTVNLVIAFLLFAGIFGIYGVPEPTTTVGSVAQCVITADEVGRECTAADEPAPAAEAGVLPGDRIASFNGEEIVGWEQMVRLIQANGDGVATVGVVRDGQDLALETRTTVNSVRSIDDREVIVEGGFLGVTPTQVREQHGLIYTTGQMGVMTWDVGQALVRLPVKVFDVAQSVVGLEERAEDSPVSIVGAGRVAGEVTSDQTSPAVDRLVFLVGLLASLNLFVGMFNFIPLLPLDGGHIAGALYEGLRRGAARVRGRPDPGFVDVAKLLPVAYVVGAALLVMGLILITADIVVPIEVT